MRNKNYFFNFFQGVIAEIKLVLIVVIDKIINKIEKMTTIIIIKKTVGDMIIEDIAISYSVAENLAKIEIIVVVIETLMIFIDIGIYKLF